MKKNFTRRILASAFMVLMAIVANGQDADNPWHLIVFDADSTEVAAFNVETLDNVSLSAGQVKIDMTWGGQAKSYNYPVASTFFGFESRKSGTATSNENIAAEKWSVYYNNGTLSIPNPVGTVSIYSISGMMIGQYPNLSNISVNLNPGFYIVTSGGNSAKLLVTNNSNGGTTAQAPQPAAMTYSNEYIPNPVVTRSAEGIKEYWNITINSGTLSLKDRKSTRLNSSH